MATEEMKTNTNLDALFTQLAEPFDPSEIKWRVTHTNRDRSRPTPWMRQRIWLHNLSRFTSLTLRPIRSRSSCGFTSCLP